MTSVTSFAFGSLRLTLANPYHWAILLLASIGVLISCALIYRRFKRQATANSTTKSRLGFSKNVHLALLIIGNIIAYVSVVLFLLPFEIKEKTFPYDVLLTQGFNNISIINEGNVDQDNADGINNRNIVKILASAERIWLLNDVDINDVDQPSAQKWLAKNYSAKVLVINSIGQLTDIWSASNAEQFKGYAAHYNPPSLLKILGDGLNEQQWQYLETFNQSLNSTPQSEANNASPAKTIGSVVAKIPPIEFRFIASQPLTGLINLHWQRQLILGQALTVTGQLQHALQGNAQFELSLVNNGRVQDSVIVQRDNTFSLTATSKIVGLLSYQLILKEVTKHKARQKKPIQVSEEITFSVVAGNQPNVLIKQSAPSFETRRLKQWLAQAQSQVRIMSKISKNTWSQQVLNTADNSSTDKVNLSTQEDSAAMRDSAQLNNDAQSYDLTQALLDNYDLLIVDSRMLLALKTKEIEALYSAIKQGLGLLINADATLLTVENERFNPVKKILHLFTFKAIDNSDNQVIANWPEKPNLAKNETISPQANSINIEVKQGDFLVTSNAGQVLVAKKSLGLGSVTLTTLNESYQWSSQISPAYYSAYWQYLLLNISRSDKATQWLLPSPHKLATVNQQQTMCFMSSLEKVYVPQMPVTPYPLFNNQKCGQFSASNKGWHVLQVLDEQQEILTEQNRYFYDKQDFSAWQQALKHNVSKDKADNRSLADEGLVTVLNYREINKFVLWILMFLSLVVLWLERKWQLN